MTVLKGRSQPLRAPLPGFALLALQLGCGVAVLIAAAALFGEIAEDVMNGDLVSAVDVPVTSWMLAHWWPPLTRATLAFTNAHGMLAVTIYGVAFAAWLLVRHERFWLLAFLLTLPGGMLVNALMKLAFARGRPVVPDPVVVLQTYSFPSGHTAGATLFYGFLAAYLVWHVKSWRWRAVIVMAAAMMIVLVAFSRVYLGAHYVTDVAAAMAEGIAWLALCLASVHALRVHASWRAAREPGP
jgi:undecaprenyl-diphosphatase